MKRGKPLKRTGGLRRTRMKRRPPKARPGHDRARLAFIRTLPCACCAKPGPNHAHHHNLTSRRGTGQKAPDDCAFSLCQSCHHALYTLTGFFRGWVRERLARWQWRRVYECREAYRKAA